MNGFDNLLGRAEALLEKANDVDSLKTVISALIKAMRSMSEQVSDLKDDAEELNEYVNRMDEDLSELEFIHSDELDGTEFHKADEDDFTDFGEDEFDPDSDDDEEDEADELDVAPKHDDKDKNNPFKLWEKEPEDDK